MENLEFYKQEANKALSSFNTAIVYAERVWDDKTLKMLLKNATIQSFEYCNEIFWKLLKQYLMEYVKINVEDVVSSRTILKISLKENIIDEEQFKILLEMIEDRNRTTHLYSQTVADKIYNHCSKYYNNMKKIIDSL